MCRDANFLEGILTIIAKTYMFYMVLDDHGFNLDFLLVFLKFPYGFSWGAFKETPYGSSSPPETPQAALSLHGTKVEGPKDQSLLGEKK